MQLKSMFLLNFAATAAIAGSVFHCIMEQERITQENMRASRHLEEFLLIRGGKTALMLAHESGCRDIVKLLKKRGAKTDFDKIQNKYSRYLSTCLTI